MFIDDFLELFHREKILVLSRVDLALQLVRRKLSLFALDFFHLINPSDIFVQKYIGHEMPKIRQQLVFLLIN